MAHRVTQVSAAMFGTVVAGFALGAVSATTVAAKDCVTAPAGAAAQGEHWYYRIEHPGNRRCWYVRGEGQAAAKDVAPQVASEATKPATPPASAALQRTVADARAEMMPADTAPPNHTDWPPPTVAPISNGNTTPLSAPMPGKASGATLVERWSDHPAANHPVQTASSNVIARVAASPQTAAARPAAEDAALSWWVMAAELVGTLALVGIVVLAILHYRRGIEVECNEETKRNDAPWDPPPGSEQSTPAIEPEQAPMNWIRLAREARQIDQQRDEVERLLSRSRERQAV